MAEIKLVALKSALDRSIREAKSISHGAVNIQIFPDYPQWKAALEALERGEKLKIVP